MYVDDCVITKNNKPYRRVLLRESFRVGKQVKKRTIANITHAPEVQIKAMKFALQNPEELTTFSNLKDSEFTADKSVGAIALLSQVAKKLGITKTLGNSRNARLFMWLIFARIMDQGVSLICGVGAGVEYRLSKAIGLFGEVRNYYCFFKDLVGSNAKLIGFTPIKFGIILYL